MPDAAKKPKGDPKLREALETLAAFVRDAQGNETYCAADMGGVVIVAARTRAARDLREWVYDRGGNPQRPKKAVKP